MKSFSKRLVRVTSITDRDGLAYGFTAEELGEFDAMDDLEALFESMRRADFEPCFIGHGRKLVTTLLESPDPMLVWNLNQGLSGITREAQAPTICEMLGHGLIGSGGWTAAVSQDKWMSGLLISDAELANVHVPKTLAIENRFDLDRFSSLPFPGPWFVKPRFEGSSRGVNDRSLCFDTDVAFSQARAILDRWGPVLIQEFIPGIDVSANAAVDNKGNLIPLEPIAVLTKHGIDCAEMKLDNTGIIRRKQPLAEIDSTGADHARKAIMDICTIFRACHYLRIDFRFVPETRKLFFLEANITPTFTARDDFSLGGQPLGWDFDRIVSNILNAAWSDFKGMEQATSVNTRIAT